MTKGGATTFECLLATVEAVALPRVPELRLGSAQLSAWSDVQGLDSVAVEAVNAMLYLANGRAGSN